MRVSDFNIDFSINIAWLTEAGSAGVGGPVSIQLSLPCPALLWWGGI